MIFILKICRDMNIPSIVACKYLIMATSPAYHCSRKKRSQSLTFSRPRNVGLTKTRSKVKVSRS